MIKTVNIEKATNSPRGLKAQNEQEKAYAKKILNKINFEYATVIFEINQKLYWCKMPFNRLTENLAISGKKCKFLSPLGKSQVLELIENGTLENIGNSADLENSEKATTEKTLSFSLQEKPEKHLTITEK